MDSGAKSYSLIFTLNSAILFPMELLIPHGYWLSFSRENPLGTLSQAQVDAAVNFLSENQSAQAFCPTGRVHFLIPDLEGRVMRSRTIAPYHEISPSIVTAGENPSVNSTERELVEVFDLLITNPIFDTVVLLVNPSHRERTQLLFEGLAGSRSRLGLDQVPFALQVTTDYLSKAQRTFLLSSAEQTLFDAREKKAKALMRRPMLRRIAEQIPDPIKGLMEDYFISCLPSSRS
ncbi:MAG: hypothetical protein US86_C0002G0082 [Candidatus Daviesbacteria bacterium GW2011_GWA2_38_24]|uniref:DUF218 domain-containing protein n=1 Tax=Candidatus Daviesbacteria bacterium GW2011_GWA2_38_24 TaxID=1618422 RepID=A0A0G0JV51_9BACT|nr:MAG: hypothetical protein US86_C0002G0082 [Candidatus Daviesbacteria bacterium GW2011_GWA2_38_24]KKQ79823.1 MAG: hypothetical protein UT01_C0027G0008 [Candidatus Daviesbacteria bacterium GW2011_GWA1_38_7]